MAKLRMCDECGREDLCKPGEILPGGIIKWLCEGCRGFEDYVKPKVSRRGEVIRPDLDGNDN